MEIEIEIQQEDFKCKMSYPVKSMYGSCQVRFYNGLQPDVYYTERLLSLSLSLSLFFILF